MSVDAGEFDWIIVGAGSAGCVLANRLSADPAHRVLLLEAGGRDNGLWTRLPIGYGKTYYDERVNWKYTSEPVPGLDGRASYWPRGRVLGGSSSINAMVWVRGHPDDYDDWGREVPGWSWSHIEPLFRQLEDWSGPADPLRGRGGPQSVYDTSGDVHPLCERFLEAAERCGLGRARDYNGAQMRGAALYQITTRGGWRASSARSYLRPIRDRPNLQVRTGAQVTGLQFDGRRATGVRWREGGEAHGARSVRELVLAAGAVNSPQLLQLAGIGPAELLREHGIEVRRALPAVGGHLQDHLGGDALYRSSVPTLNQELRPWHAKVRAGARFLLGRRGPLSLSVNQAGGFVDSEPGLARPNLQLYFSPLSYTRAPPGTRPLMSPDAFPGFLLGFNPCRPTSRGRLGIRSADPYDAPRIQPNYLDTEHDRLLMRRGMQLVRQLAATAPLADIIEQELLPGPHCDGDDALDAYVREAAWTVFHPCGTCRMGTDEADSVVDARLRVHGVDGLRVADASVFPMLPSGNTNAPAIVTGERAAQLMLEDAR